MKFLTRLQARFVASITLRVYVTFMETFHLDNSGCPFTQGVANPACCATMIDTDERNSVPARETNREKSGKSRNTDVIRAECCSFYIVNYMYLSWRVFTLS